MREEYLQGWLPEASMEKNLVKNQWRLVVRCINRMFKYGMVQDEVACETMVFFSKGKGQYQGIGLVEVVWKVCAHLVNF